MICESPALLLHTDPVELIASNHAMNERRGMRSNFVVTRGAAQLTLPSTRSASCSYRTWNAMSRILRGVRIGAV